MYVRLLESVELGPEHVFCYTNSPIFPEYSALLGEKTSNHFLYTNFSEVTSLHAILYTIIIHWKLNRKNLCKPHRVIIIQIAHIPSLQLIYQATGWISILEFNNWHIPVGYLTPKYIAIIWCWATNNTLLNQNTTPLPRLSVLASSIQFLSVDFVGEFLK